MTRLTSRPFGPGLTSRPFGPGLTSRPLLLTTLLLAAACDGPSTPPSSTTPASTTPSATPTPPTPTKPSKPEPDEEAASFASPKTPDNNAAEPAPGGPPDPELATRIQEKFGDRCKYERACGDLVGVDCGAAVDGPYYYVTRKDLTTVSTCGGACRRGCTDCPPKAWTCPSY